MAISGARPRGWAPKQSWVSHEEVVETSRNDFGNQSPFLKSRSQSLVGTLGGYMV